MEAFCWLAIVRKVSIADMLRKRALMENNILDICVMCRKEAFGYSLCGGVFVMEPIHFEMGLTLVQSGLSSKVGKGRSLHVFYLFG